MIAVILVDHLRLFNTRQVIVIKMAAADASTFSDHELDVIRQAGKVLMSKIDFSMEKFGTVKVVFPSEKDIEAWTESGYIAFINSTTSTVLVLQEKMNKHRHEIPEVFTLLSGRVTVQLDDKTIHVEKGEKFEAPAGAWHSLASKTEGVPYILVGVMKKKRNEFASGISEHTVKMGKI